MSEQTREELVGRIADILSPAVNRSAPYAKVMIARIADLLAAQPSGATAPQEAEPLTMSAAELADCRRIGGTQVDFVNRCSRLLREIDALHAASLTPEASSAPAQETTRPTLVDVLAALQRWHDAYPIEIFGELPPPVDRGEPETCSRDCIAGAMGRHMSMALQQEMRELWADAASTGTAPQGWQPIATAPKDGSWIMLYVRWQDKRDIIGCGQWTWDGEGRKVWFWPWSNAPTHWQPLPSPPPDPTTGGQG